MLRVTPVLPLLFPMLALAAGASAQQFPAHGATAATQLHEEVPERGAANTSSPYRTSLLRDGLLLGTAAGGAALGHSMAGTRTVLTEEKARQLTRASVNRFDRSATSRYSPELIDASEHVASVLGFAPLALLLDPKIRSDWATLGVMYLQTTLLAKAAADITKGSYDRYRPYVYNDGLTFEEKVERNPGGAFFSSAATYAFARAVFLSTVFNDNHPDSRWKPVVWAGSMSTAAIVGYLRYESGLHYPSDVLVGALVGGAIGYGVPRMHRVGGERFTVTPMAGHRGVGVGTEIRF